MNAIPQTLLPASIASSDGFRYTKYSLDFVIVLMLVTLSAPSFDRTIFIRVLHKFNFWFPMAQFILSQVLELIIVYLNTEGNGVAVLGRTLQGVAYVLLMTLVLASDAAIYTSITIKRAGLLGVITICIVHSFTNIEASKVEGEIANSHNVCWNILSACASPHSLLSGLFRTIAIFAAKMLYHIIRFPRCFMMLEKKENYSIQNI